MRALIALSLTAMIFSSTVAEAGMSTGPHRILPTTRPAATHTAATHTAPVTRHVAANRPRENRPVHMAQAEPPAILAPIGAVGHAIGRTLGGILGH